MIDAKKKFRMFRKYQDDVQYEISYLGKRVHLIGTYFNRERQHNVEEKYLYKNNSYVQTHTRLSESLSFICT